MSTSVVRGKSLHITCHSERSEESALKRFAPFAAIPGSVLLESAENGRYSAAAHRPFAVVQAKKETVSLLTAQGLQRFQADPLAVLERLLEENAQACGPYGPGAFGYFSYELGYRLQNLPCLPLDDLNLPDLWFAFYDEVIVHDRLLGQTTVERGKRRPKIPAEKLGGLSSPKNREIKSGFTSGDYRKQFGIVMENIAAGNCYQINLCRRFSGLPPLPAWETYLRLRRDHPTPYCAYLNAGDHAVLSASPELFLQKRGTRVETRPIKGTCLKARQGEDEQEVLENLKQGPKERAEHIMIVDLERNDLGRICNTGSVTADSLFRLESCGSVHHLVSTVSGTLRPGTGLRDILAAVFPGGSITGAPKRKAMEIIGRLEPAVRGVYTGALGWIGFSGDFTLNLPIRTLLVQNQTAHAYFGGGIVADSQCELEYQELLNKGLPFFKLLESADHACSPA